MPNATIDTYFSGNALYGDDFAEEDIAAWYADEKEGYANLSAAERYYAAYPYHAFNTAHGFQHLPDGPFHHALGFGSAKGDEFAPIIDRIDRLTILEPSDQFVQATVCGTPVDYVQPDVSGTLPFAPGTFDLVTCFGVLHHIPNVSHVLQEIARCLTADGHALIREPIISMGDWRKPRPGLTKRERGIPQQLFRNMISTAGLSIVRERFCMFPGVSEVWAHLGRGAAYNSPLATRLDGLLSSLTRWNVSYHARTKAGKLRPRCLYLVLRRTT
ncbi:MAG: class I SAM-dependent methyltransferase [Bacteroidota bacterium]